jgi:predicted DCC family thiol-disulfide oxidoreductase YuxK
MGASFLPDGSVLIDGHCVLCSAAFRFVARRDPACQFRFAPLQGELGQIAAQALGIDPEDPASFAVVLRGRVYLKSTGVIHVMRRLTGWRWTIVLLAVPGPLRDWVYDWVARNRYQLFGRLNACAMPEAGLERHVLTTLPVRTSV